MPVRQWVGCMGGSVLTVSSEKHDLQLETNWSATIDALVGVRSIVMLPARVEFRLDLAVTSNRTEPVGLYYMVISCKKQDRISTEAYFENGIALSHRTAARRRSVGWWRVIRSQASTEHALRETHRSNSSL